MTFSTIVVLPVTERMHTADEMLSFTHANVRNASDSSVSGAGTSAGARNFIFVIKIQHMVCRSQPACPDRRNYSAQHSAETSLQAGFCFCFFFWQEKKKISTKKN